MTEEITLKKSVPIIEMSKTDEFQPTKEEALGKIALQLAETKDNKILTDLDSRTINQLSILVGISDQLDIKTYQNICNTYMRLRVSNKRLGRKELLEIAKAVREEEMNKMQRFRNFFHLG
jgi:hypothetical protein